MTPLDNSSAVAVVPAAGAGVRMGKGKAKQFREFCGKPMLAATLEVFENSPAIRAVVVAVPGNEVIPCKKEIVERYGLTKVEAVVPGGERRQDSVRLGLEAVQGGYELAVIHDGVRPLLKRSLLEEVLEAAGKYRAVITALPVKETVKEADENMEVVRTHERGGLWLVQTPQVFRYQDILNAHYGVPPGVEATDDAVLVERMGIPVKVILGQETNIKVTTPYDLELAEFMAGKRGKGGL